MNELTEKKSDNFVLDLFKYYAPKYGGEDNLSFYTRGEIYFQRPVNFNDPWDCSPPEISLNRQINQLKDIWFRWGLQNGEHYAKVEWEKIKQKPRSEIKQLFYDLFKEALRIQRSKIGIFSLLFIPDSELMWSHYGKSHTGYMLHFQIDMSRSMNDSSLKDVIYFMPVVYKKERELWSLVDYYKDREKHVYDLVGLKSSAWEYEHEFRLLNVNKYGFVKIPDNWLKSIVVGLNASGELREKLKDIGERLNVPVFHSIMNKKEYKIDIPGFSVTGEDGKRLYKKILESKFFEFNKEEYNDQSR